MGKFMIYFPMTLSVVLFSSLFVALVINALITAEFMQLEEKEMSKKTLIKLSSIVGGIGLLLVIIGFVSKSGGARGIGNLMVFFAIMLWVYKYYLSRAQVYFMEVVLVKLENFYKRALIFALSGKKPIIFLFGTIGLLIFSFVLVGIAQPKVLFFPENQPNQIMTYIEFPEGTDIAKTNAFTKEIEKKYMLLLTNIRMKKISTSW